MKYIKYDVMGVIFLMIGMLLWLIDKPLNTWLIFLLCGIAAKLDTIIALMTDKNDE